MFKRNYFADNGKAAFSIRAGARVTVSGNDFSGNKGGAWDIEDGADVVRSAGAPGGS